LCVELNVARLVRKWALMCGADELLGEKEKYKTISEDLDFTFTELAGF